MFGLEKKHIRFILDVLNKNLKNKTVKYYIFGSRAKGNFNKYSDIDIALNSETKISDIEIVNIYADFENSTLPYEVDVVDLNSIDDNFKKLITPDLIEIKV